MLFGIMVCSILTMDHEKPRRELSQEIGKKTKDKHLKAKGYMAISKQLDILVATAARYSEV